MKREPIFACAAVLLIVIAVLAWRLADVERRRYLLMTGMCQNTWELSVYVDCLETKQPRTSWWWNLFYGVRG